MKVVDANMFIHGPLPEGELVTTPAVMEEIRGRLSGMMVEQLIPSEKSVARVRKAAERTGDVHDLSENDIELVALALEKKAVLATDDYSMQNVCEELGVEWEGGEKRGIREKWEWVRVCTGCGREQEGEVCEVCGSSTKRRPRDK